MTSGYEDVSMMDYLDAVAQAKRDPSIPEGSVVGTQDVDGATFNFTKRRSLINAGGKALPERILVFDRQGNPSYVPPTMAIKRVNGVRVFFSPPEYERMVASGDLPARKEQQYITETCPICDERRFNEGNLEPKRFTSLTQFRGHMRAFHEGEWSDIQSEQSAYQQQAQLDAILKLAGGSVNPAISVHACDVDDCPRFFDSAQGLSQHKSTGHK